MWAGPTLPALALLASVLAVGAPAAAAAATTADPLDTHGPLDLTAAALAQRDIRMVLQLQTDGGWESRELTATAGRELCVTVLRGDPASPSRFGRICVTRRAARTALSFTPLNADGTAAGAPRRLAARTARPTPTMFEASFLPAAAGLTVGPYAWYAESAWTDAGDPNCARTCGDRLPDTGEIAAGVQLLAVAPCFGAAARDPAAPCTNPELRDTVTPRPSQAKVLADPYCDKRERSGLLIACAFGAARADAAHTFALAGDSHAANYKTALAVVTLAKRWRGVSILRSGCPATRGAAILATAVSSRRCRTWNRQLRAWLARHHEVDTVVLAAHRGARVKRRRGRSATQSVRAGYRDEIRTLLASGKHVVVIRDPPSSTRAQLRCVTKALRSGRSAARSCSLPRSDALAPDDLVQAARSLHSRRVRVIDLTRQFCDAKRCFAVIGGVLVRHDATHLTQTFAATLGPFLARALDR